MTEYILGRDVTEQAKAKEKRGTVVISFRINADEFDRVCDLALSKDRTASWVARRAFRIGLMPHIPADTAGNIATWTDGSGS